MALGEPPPFRQIVREGVRYEQEPAPGSIPPRQVMLNFGSDASETVALHLGRISPPLQAPAGSGPLALRQREADKAAEPWLKLDRPENGNFLVLLWRDPTASSWEKARSMILPDDATARPPGSIYFANLSSNDVRIIIASEKLVLAAGTSFARTVPTGVEQPFQILLPDRSGNWKPLHSSVITQNSGERSLVVVYRADGKSPRRPLKVSVQREPAPTPPLPD